MYSKRDHSWLSRWASHRMRLATVSLPISKHSSFQNETISQKTQHNCNQKSQRLLRIIKIEVNQIEKLTKSAKPIREIAD